MFIYSLLLVSEQSISHAYSTMFAVESFYDNHAGYRTCICKDHTLSVVFVRNSDHAMKSLCPSNQILMHAC